MSTYEPVWLSTDEHLEQLHSIYGQASLFEKMFGAYRLPPNYPHIQMRRWMLPGSKLPIVEIASGSGRIENAKFSFKSAPFNVFGYTTHNLLDLQFDIGASELVEVAHATAESPVLRYYNIPFTRIRTRRSGLLGDFLVCVGGIGPSMTRINAQSSELFQGLSNLINSRGDQLVNG